MNAESCTTIYLIDDDDAFRRSLIFLLESVGWPVRDYDSAQAFLDAHVSVPDDLGCLLLDIRMPMISGMHLQQRLNAQGWHIPIVFITGHGDVELAVQAMKAGASDFLEKPFRDQALLDAVALAVQRGAQQRRDAQRRGHAIAMLEGLSPREAEVARLLARGHANKNVAQKLGISEKTVHIHRQRVMEKTACANATELARLLLLAEPELLD